MSHPCYDFDYSTYSTSITRSEIPVDFSANFDESSVEPMESDNIEEPTNAPLLKSLPAPRDKYNFVFITFIFFGVCVLLPWNFFITANDYWMYKFRDVNLNTTYNPKIKTPLQATFTSYLAITNNLPFIFVLFLNPFIAKKVTEKQRNGMSIIATTLLFVVVTTLVKVNSDAWQNTFFAVTMILVFLISIVCGVFQGGITGLASLFPSKYMHGTMIGQAIAGIISSLAEILSLLNYENYTNSVSSAFGYFLCAVSILVIAAACYFFLHHSLFFQFYTRTESFTRKGTMLLAESPSATFSLLIFTYKKTWTECLTALLCYWVTLSVFPAICVLVVSEHYSSGTEWNTVFFLPVCCFLLFNISDFIGRSVSNWLPLPSSWDWQLLLLAFLRIVYVPLFMLCNAHPRSHLPVEFYDVPYIVFIITMGLTNGYLCTLAMISGPKKVDQGIKEITGFLLAAFLGTGLALGSLTSYLLVRLL